MSRDYTLNLVSVISLSFSVLSQTTPLVKFRPDPENNIKC